MANPLQIVITVDTRSGNAELDGTKRKIEDIGPAGQKAGRQASDGLSALERQARASSVTIKNEFSAVGDIIRLAFASAGASAAKSAVDISAQFQLAEVGIGAFVKEGENAKQVFSDLKQFSLQSPLDFSSILKASNQLLALDTAAKDLIPTLESLSGAVFAVTAGQNTPERLNDVIIALGQIKAAGALTGEEFRQLRNANIVTIQELADAFDVTVEQFRKAIVERTVPAAEVIPAILQKVSQRFGKFNEDIRTSAAVAFSNFRDALQQAADNATREYLPALVDWIGKLAQSLRELSEWVRTNKNTLEDLASGFAAIGIAITSYKVAIGVASVVQALGGLAAGVNPVGLVAAGFGLLAFQVYRNVQALEDLAEAQKKTVSGKTIRDLIAGGKTAQDLEKLGYSLTQVKEALTGSSGFDKAFDPSKVADFGIKVAKSLDDRKFKLGNGAKELEEQQKRITAAEKRASEILEEARRKEVEGLARVLVEYQQYRAELGLSEKANRTLAEAVQIRLRTEGGEELRRVSGERVKAIREEFEAFTEYSAKRLEKETQVNDEILQRRQEADQILLGIEDKFAQRQRDSELRNLSALNATTLQDRLAIEERRAQIETQFLEQSLTRKARAVDFEIELEITKNEAILRAAGATEEKIAEMRESFQRLGLARSRALAVDADSEIRAATEGATVRQAQLIRDNNLRVFEGLKRNVEGLFDAVVTRSKSWGEAIADSFKLPILAAFKEIVSTRIAAMLFQIFGGGPVSLSGGQPNFSGAIGTTAGGGSNVLGRLLGIGGAAALGGGGSGGGFSFPGAPGGTPGFAGPVSLGGTVAGGGGATSGITGSLAGSAASLKGILSSLGNIGRGVGTGSALAGRGVGGTAGGALLAGGGILAFDGLRRGGLLGLAETTAGGALIGAKFGGPLGAAIGAGVGALAGTIRLFVKGAQEKIVEKVRAVYGITISSGFARDPLLGIIKQGFGGNIDVGIRSAQVRDLIELYAMSTGQNSGGINTTRPIASSFALSGGALNQQPVFQNGISLGVGQASSAAPAPTIIQLDPAATEAFLQGQAIAAMGQNPRAVQGALLSAGRQNAGRRESLALAVNPGLLMA